MSAQRQNPDGSWTEAQPIPWADTIDWEIRGRGRQREARAYWHEHELALVPPGRAFRLRMLACRIALRRRLAAAMREQQARP